jgi:hypothetical protein
MAKKRKNKQTVQDIALKANRKANRESVSNINQKAQVFADKRTKRQKTRQTQNDKAIKEQLN